MGCCGTREKVPRFFDPHFHIVDYSENGSGPHEPKIWKKIGVPGKEQFTIRDYEEMVTGNGA